MREEGHRSPRERAELSSTLLKTRTAANVPSHREGMTQTTGPSKKPRMGGSIQETPKIQTHSDIPDNDVPDGSPHCVIRGLPLTEETGSQEASI